MSYLKSVTVLAGLVWITAFAPSAAAQPAVSDTLTFIIQGQTFTFDFGEATEPTTFTIFDFFGVAPTGNAATYGSRTGPGSQPRPFASD